jgi:predicted component of type VI protein secretion system
VALLEIWSLHGRDLVQLDADRLIVGKSADVDLQISGDASVSRVHAMLERVGSRWVIRDVGSMNGTLVNGERIIVDHVLRDDDEIILGRTRIRFFDRQASGDLSTERMGAPPKLTHREKEVLVELCRPLLSATPFTQPAQVRDIAAKLFVTEAAVKQHLGHLYDKFGIFGEDGDVPRRVRLANAALETGTVKLADLRDDPPPDG